MKKGGMKNFFKLVLLRHIQNSLLDLWWTYISYRIKNKFTGGVSTCHKQGSFYTRYKVSDEPDRVVLGKVMFMRMEWVRNSPCCLRSSGTSAIPNAMASAGDETVTS